MHYEPLARVLILLSLANGSPVIAKRIFGDNYAAPVDGNARFFDGRPLVGPSKTIRGIVISLLVTALGAILLGLPFWLGLLVASTAMAGDLLSSFLKRRLHLVASSKATGLDQIPESLFPLLACRSELSLSGLDIAVAYAIFLRAKYYFRGCFSGWDCATAPIDAAFSSARRRQCKVISGKQLMRTGTIADPTPVEVYPAIL